MAMGAAGIWTGSVWLATTEAETSPVFREKMVAARSRGTIRSRGRTAPGEPAMQRVNRAAEAGNAEARQLVSYFVGQGVGLVDSVVSARQVVADFMEEFAEALEDMRGFML
jgi:NAD(P)H-dependent flavin oxidoreductase YrpB (nitropropane dioxygenase family)